MSGGRLALAGLASLAIFLAGAAPVAGEDLDPTDPQAQEAVRALIGKRAPKCNVRFVRIEPFGSGPWVIGVVAEGAAGTERNSLWSVSDDLAISPQDPVAGEIQRRCKRDPKRPKDRSGWRSLPYFDGSSATVRSNDRWKRAREIHRSDGSSKPLTNLADLTQFGAALWSPRCKPGKQRISVRRKIYLPGPGTFGNLGFQVLAEPFGSNPIRWAKLSVNGRKLARARFGTNQSANMNIPAKRFKYGKNKLELEAQKGKTGRCNPRRGRKGGAAAAARLGVQVAFLVQFEADVEVTDRELSIPGQGADDLERSQYRHEITVTNNGPSGVHSGIFGVDINNSDEWTAQDGYSAEVSEGPKGSQCGPPVVHDMPPQFDEIDCTFKNLKPGESGSFVLTVTARPTNHRYSFGWFGGALDLFDPVEGNASGGQDSVRWCLDADMNGICD